MTAPARRLPWLDRVADVALTVIGVLCLIGIGALIGVAIFASYLAQSGVLR